MPAAPSWQRQGKSTLCVSYPTSLAPGRRHSRIAAGFRYAPELPVNPVFHPTLLIVKERPVVWGDGVAVCGVNNSHEYI